MEIGNLTPAIPGHYRDIQAVTLTWSANDANAALSGGAVLLAVSPNPAAQELEDAFAILVGLPSSAELTPWMKKYFGLEA